MIVVAVDAAGADAVLHAAVAAEPAKAMIVPLVTIIVRKTRPNETNRAPAKMMIIASAPRNEKTDLAMKKRTFHPLSTKFPRVKALLKQSVTRTKPKNFTKNAPTPIANLLKIANANASVNQIAGAMIVVSGIAADATVAVTIAAAAMTVVKGTGTAVIVIAAGVATNANVPPTALCVAR